MKFNHAAMFGLDARIALAIFGALSIMSSALLYKSIKEIKITSFITEMKEVGKAWEQFYLDTGKNLPPINPDPADYDFYNLQSKALVENPGFNNWNGPYLNYEVDAVENALEHPDSDIRNIHVMLLRSDTLWNGWYAGRCTTGVKCYIWVRFFVTGDFTTKNEDLLNKLDHRIDGGDGNTSGSFKWSSVNIFYRVSPYPNPND